MHKARHQQTQNKARSFRFAKAKMAQKQSGPRRGSHCGSMTEHAHDAETKLWDQIVSNHRQLIDKV